ncbi:helix-turn-helix domain-containing protein [Agrococcus sp. DT81.2]|uniref:cupin domain-containing protein n=1 Tax=Agrococcus sp. DT81.2 TaxID=3393414 RepID=UPI003CE57DB5
MTTYTRRRTDDRDEAERIVTQLYLPHRLDLADGSAGLAMEVAGMRVGAVTVGRLAYGRRIRLRTADAENFHANITLRGRARSRSGTGEPVATAPGEGLVYSPEAPAEIAWAAGCQQLCLMIPRALLESRLEQLLGRSLRGPLIFDFAADLRSPFGRRWRTVLDLLNDELDHPTVAVGDARMAAHVEGFVLDGLLLGQPHSHSGAVDRDRPTRLGSAIKRALELMEERPAEPWTTLRLATEVHLSARALQEGFRRDLGTPPMTYLRQIRLRRAREALLAADRDATTVRAVARGLGILHLGRFAAAYRDAFREAPSETLHRPA